MTLLFDRRAELWGRPGLHALIGGVSAYPYLPGGKSKRKSSLAMTLRGLGQFAAGAPTAAAMQKWLVDNRDALAVPLATCRLLLSPIARLSETEQKVAPCTLDSFLEAASAWRDDASSHAENMTLFYAAGYGLRLTKEETLVLLEDFGDGVGGILRHTASIQSLFRGMAPSSRLPNLAHRQLYFVDTVRVPPSLLRDTAWLSSSQVFDVELTGFDDRSAMLFNASARQSRAAAGTAEPTTFSRRLLDCLDGAAAMPRDRDGTEEWAITAHSLVSGLERAVAEANAEFGEDQDLVVGGLIRDTVLRVLPGPPLVAVTIEIEPPAVVPLTRVQVIDDQGHVVKSLPAPLSPHPVKIFLPAGVYRFDAVVEPDHLPFATGGRWRSVVPPVARFKLQLAAP